MKRESIKRAKEIDEELRSMELYEGYNPSVILRFTRDNGGTCRLDDIFGTNTNMNKSSLYLAMQETANVLFVNLLQKRRKELEKELEQLT